MTAANVVSIKTAVEVVRLEDLPLSYHLFFVAMPNNLVLSVVIAKRTGAIAEINVRPDL
jgi:hypothetical protein